MRAAIRALVVLLVSLVGLSAAAVPERTDDVDGSYAMGGSPGRLDCPGEVVWDTGMFDEFWPLECHTAVSAACFVNAIDEGQWPADGRRGADDFVASSDAPITRMKIWGRYNLNGYQYHAQTPGSMHGFCVKFYAYDGDCPDGSASGEEAIGTIVYAEYARSFVEEEIFTGLPRSFKYCIDLDPPFVPTEGQAYWVSVSADFDYTSYEGGTTQWFWRLYQGLGISTCEAAWWDTWGAPGTNWKPVSQALSDPCLVDWDAAFVLYSAPLPPPTGACCLPQGDCQTLTADGCRSENGQYLGDGLPCGSETCPTQSIVAWGDNEVGQCAVPAPDADFVNVAAGAWHSLGLKSDGSIIAWGTNMFGECNVPGPNTDFVSIAGGGSHSLGLKRDGTIVAWGWNLNHQCNVPSPNAGFVAIAAGFSHSLGVKSDGTVVAWGDNEYGQCDVPEPNTHFVAVVGGWHHSLGLKSDGTIVAWGGNGSGQSTVPDSNGDFVAIAAGVAHSLGLRSDGRIVAWGGNSNGECNVPSPNTDFIEVSSTGFHCLGRKSDGTIVAWGDNESGQCDVPSPNADFVKIAAGGEHSLGVRMSPPSAVQDPWASGMPGTDKLPVLTVAPNPSTGQLLIRYALPRSTQVTIEVFSAAGTLVRRLDEGTQAAGQHGAAYDGRDENGRTLVSGVYVVRLLTDDGMRTGRVVIAR